MVVDIPSVPVLENMYNNINRIEKDRGLFCCYFSKAGKGGQQSIKIVSLKIHVHCGDERSRN